MASSGPTFSGLPRRRSSIASSSIAIAFDGRLTDKRRERIRQVLATLVTTGAARTAGAAYFVPR